MNEKQTSRSKHFDFIVLDLLCVEVSFFIAYAIRYRGDISNMPESYYWINVIIIFAHFAVVFFAEGYSGILARGYLIELKKIIVHNIELFAILQAVLFVNKNTAVYSRIFIAVFFAVNVVVMYTVRCMRKKYLHSRKNTSKGKNCMLVIADYEYLTQLIGVIHDMPYSAYVLQGAVSLDRDAVGQTIDKVKVVSNRKDMFEYAKKNVIDDVLILKSGRDLADIVGRFTAMGITVHVGVNALLPKMENLIVENIGNYTVLTISNSVMSFKQRFLKRVIDLVVSVIGIVIMAILYIIFAPIIYVQSPGPIFFSQVRVGKNGRYFKIYKFRTMYLDAEERKRELQDKNKMQGLMFKIDDDPRVTPIGKFLRKTSIDEFPQFINIFKGEMSLVGTRPPTVDEYEMYSEHHKSRLAMKPGLTGLWQVSGRSDITDFEEIVKLDNEYITNFSISLDCKIIFKTIVTVLSGKGSV